MDLTPAFGLLGSICASALFFPQVLKAWRDKKTRDLSWVMISIGLLNGFSWTIYGVLKNDPFIYITNTLLTSALVILALLKRKFDKKSRN